MKKRLLLLLLLATTSLSALAGAIIETQANALYWRPCTSTRPYALSGISNQTTTSGKILSVDPDFHWGVRVKAEYTDTNCRIFGGFKATRLWSVDRALLTGGGFETLLIPGATIPAESLKETLDIDYWTIDVRGGHSWLCIPRLQADLYVLGRYAYLRRRENGASRAVIGELERLDTLNLNSRFKGGGFGLGFGTRYDLPCSFRLRGDIVIGGLYGEQLYATFSKIATTGLAPASEKVKQKRSNCLPFFDVRAVLEYSRCLCDFLTVAGQLGWEYNGYPGAIPVPGQQGFVTGISRQSIGFGGPFVALALRF
jgi:Legionella pneumophila major outer membrane protein precursor